MIITISGKAGSGKDTIGKLLSKKLGFKMIKGTMKTYAKRMGIDILEFEMKYAEKSDEWDKKLDEWQKKVIKKYKDCILVSMLSAYNIPNADFKIFLTASVKARANRISKRDKIPKKNAVDYVKKRDRVTRNRIKRIYGIDFWDKKFYDMVIDTSKLEPEKIVSKILEKLKRKIK